MVDHRGQRGSARAAKRDGKTVAGLIHTTATIPADAGDCTVRFKVAAGPWNTIHTMAGIPRCGGAQDGASSIFGPAFAIATERPYQSLIISRTRPCGWSPSTYRRNEHAGKIQSTIDVTGLSTNHGRI